MSNNPMECEECGHTLEVKGFGTRMHCPNDDCLSVTGDKVENGSGRTAKYRYGGWENVTEEPGMAFVSEEVDDEERVSGFADILADPKLEGSVKPFSYRPTEDPVDNPSHYKLFGTIEVIDMIKELLTEEEFRGYLKGNCLKYRLRAGKKDNIEQDIKKAMKYEEWLK